MTTLTKVAHGINSQLIELKDRICNDGQFCDDIAMTALAGVTLWIMILAMQPIM
jgi:hypothetical protein